MLKRLRHTLARLSRTRRTANCARIDALLPLYVADDLPPARARVVAQHLQACAGCRAQADEYAASRAWLQAGAQVSFEDEFYDGIRANVLRQINQRQTPAPFFAPRQLAYVAASLLLLALLGVLAWHVQNQSARDGDKLLVNATPQPTPAASREEQPTPMPDPSRTDEQATTRQPAPLRSPVRRALAPSSRVPRERAPRHDSARAPLREVQTAATPAQTNGAPQAGAEMARIEFQTADPNIRIIWLAPQPAGVQPHNR